MVLPIPSEDASTGLVREAIVRAELLELTKELEDLNTYRDYYEGDQLISYGTDKFQERFGDAFKGFRDNWCEVVIDAIADKLEVTGIRVGRAPEVIKQWRELSTYLWELFLNVDIDGKQPLLHSGVFIEGRSTAIIWPDKETGFSVNWNPAQIVRVRYDDDNQDRVRWAVKRWQTPTGAIYITYYTPEAIFKYVESEGESETTRSDKNITPLDAIPDQSGVAGMSPRKVDDEPWPLPNPLGEVPVVEFPNKSGNSEIRNVVPMQDAVNYVIQQMFVAGEFHAFAQKAIATKQAAPTDGWSNDPGKIWHFEPMVDTEGRYVMPEFHQFGTSDPSTYIKIVEMFLQHVALTTKTPMRMFFQSDRSGRGDAPSGESLKVEDKPLLDKVRKRSAVLGNRWYRMVRLAYKAARAVPEFRSEMNPMIPEGAGDRLPYGEVRWRDDRVEYRAAAIAEAKALIDIGWPRVLAWKHAGFSPEEIAEAEEALEKQMQEDLERQQEQIEMQAKASGGNDESGDGVIRPKPGRSGPRPSNQ
jgi:hypothetical protein